MPIAPVKVTTKPLVARLVDLGILLGNVGPLPEAWNVGSPSVNAEGEQVLSVELLECTSFKVLTNAWKKAATWNVGLNNGLCFMLSIAASTKSIGEQLWGKAIGPPSSYKTSLVEGLALSERFVISKDTIRGVYSGFDDGKGTDNSLASKIRDRTLAIKDGDGLLKAPNLPQILSELRGLYDRTGRTDYRNGMGADYKNLRCTILICGTSSLREIDESELGARFLDCVIMDKISDEHEDDVALRAAYQEDRNVSIQAEDEMLIQHAPELAEAMQLTGGYLEYLRINATDLVSQVKASHDSLYVCGRLGKFVSFMRARPGKKGENTDREFCARLTKQLTRLAKFSAVVLNKKALDKTVMKFVCKVALDTARGEPLEIVHLLAQKEYVKLGLQSSTIAGRINKRRQDTDQLIRFLKTIGVLELNFVKSKNSGMTSQHTHYKLTENILKLYKEVMKHA